MLCVDKFCNFIPKQPKLYCCQEQSQMGPNILHEKHKNMAELERLEAIIGGRLRWTKST